MILSQITSGSRMLTSSFLISLRMNQICKSHIKELYKQQKVLYCVIKEQPKVDVEVDKVGQINNYDNEKGYQYVQQYENLKSEKLHSKVSNKSVDYIAKLYPTPMVDLINIYHLVNNEFGKSCITVSYKQIAQKTQCSINILWPSNMSFTHEGSTKKTAGYYTALKCLQWLYENNRISKLKPLLYTKSEIRNILDSEASVPIHLQLEFKDEIKSLLHTFEYSIRSIMTERSAIDVGKKALEEKELETKELPNTSKLFNANLARMLEERENKSKDLPIYNYREEILDSLEHNQILLIKGDTGCGKSTQIPQLIMDAYTQQGRAHECNIIVSQPRRVAAVSLAHRIAAERKENIGDVVGYHVRFDNTKPRRVQHGSITFYTTGVLLRILESNPTLDGISHIIIDEIHERSLQSDMLLKLFKDLLKDKPSVKLIIMSATIDMNLFKQYLSCKVIDIPGTLYPVKMYFKDDIFKQPNSKLHNNIKYSIPFQQVVKLIRWIITNKPPGSILCFLPGWQEIKTMHNLLEEIGMKNLIVLPLHSKVPLEVQQEAFEPVPKNVRKIILATDVAESSITIKDISYVIDTAIKKESKWYGDGSVPMLNYNFISKANLHQRRGRAGRIGPGESYHLITKEEYNSLPKYSIPEILRTSLEDAVITSRKFSNENIYDFFGGMPEPPNSTSLSRAISNLKELGILDENESLTSLGIRVSSFSVDPRLSRAVILSCVFQCLNPILLLSSLPLGEKNIVSLNEQSNEKLAVKTQKLTFHTSSDHIAIIQYFNYWSSCNGDSDYTYNPSYFHTVKRLHSLHMTELKDSGMLESVYDKEAVNMCSDNNEIVRAVLFAATNHLLKRSTYGNKRGYFTKFADTLTSENKEIVKLTNESVNYKRREWPSELLTYIKKIKLSRGLTVSETSILTPLSVLLFSHNKVSCYKKRGSATHDMETVFISISNINNVQFFCDRQTAELLLSLRDVLWEVANYIIKYEGLDDNRDNLKLVKSYRTELMNLVASMLYQASKEIDSK